MCVFTHQPEPGRGGADGKRLAVGVGDEHRLFSLWLGLVHVRQGGAPAPLHVWCGEASRRSVVRSFVRSLSWGERNSKVCRFHRGFSSSSSSSAVGSYMKIEQQQKQQQQQQQQHQQQQRQQQRRERGARKGRLTGFEPAAEVSSLSHSLFLHLPYSMSSVRAPIEESVHGGTKPIR